MASRCRTSNFSLKERCVFIELLVTNYPFLHEDKGHSKVSNEMRTTAWNDLTQDFHVILADRNVYRTTKQLKTLYENIKHKIKRNISQGVMQALQTDVKTAKDIPLSLFMDLKSQYEGELGKSGDTGYTPDYATGSGQADGSTGCSHSGGAATGRQGCKYRNYTNSISTRHERGTRGGGMGGVGHNVEKWMGGSGAHLNVGHKVEKWMNSKNEEIIIVDNKTIIFNGCRNSRYPERSQVLSNLPPNIGVRYPKNLSKNIYELSDSSEDEEDEEEEDNEDELEEEEEVDEDELVTGGEDSNQGSGQVDQEMGNHGNCSVNNSGEQYSFGYHGSGDEYGNHGNGEAYSNQGSGQMNQEMGNYAIRSVSNSGERYSFRNYGKGDSFGNYGNGEVYGNHGNCEAYIDQDNGQVDQEIDSHGNRSVNNTGEQYSFRNHGSGNYDVKNGDSHNNIDENNINGDPVANGVNHDHDMSGSHAANGGHQDETNGQMNNNDQYNDPENHVVISREYDDNHMYKDEQEYRNKKDGDVTGELSNGFEAGGANDATGEKNDG